MPFSKIQETEVRILHILCVVRPSSRPLRRRPPSLILPSSATVPRLPNLDVRDPRRVASPPPLRALLPRRDPIEPRCLPRLAVLRNRPVGRVVHPGVVNHFGAAEGGHYENFPTYRAEKVVGPRVAARWPKRESDGYGYGEWAPSFERKWEWPDSAKWPGKRVCEWQWQW